MVKIFLRGSELISTVTDKSVESNINEKTLFVIVPTLGKNPLRAVQECELAKGACDKLPERYAKKTVINKITLL